tara:strand:- start:340 stop:753 length:414 start_codon:yes stop_codon:yes gene_type:complete
MNDNNSVTSWTNEQLFKLSDINKHKITKDSDGVFRWYHNINNKWELHSIWDFTNYRKPSSYLHFWLSNWAKELNQRQTLAVRKRTAINRKLRVLKKSLRKTTSDKIQELCLLFPEFTQEEVANELEISIKTVQRALR